MPLAALLAPVLVFAPVLGSAPVPTDPRAERDPATLPRLTFVATTDLDQQALAAELAMRMPELELSTLDAAPPERDFVYIQARRETGRIHRVAIILSDGRAYYELVDLGEAGSAERVLASAIANLLFSIESGAVEPDERDVAVPLASADELGTASTELDEDPAPTEPAESRVEEPEARAAALEIGLGLGLAQATALGAPRFADRHLGWFGGLALELRAANGLFGALELRPGGLRVGDYGLTRVGVGLGFGLAWRVSALELVTALSASVTPWVVASEGQAEPVTKIADGATGRPPLLSFGLRLSPGYRVEFDDRGPLRSLRVGPRVAITGGFVASQPPRVAGLQTPEGRELFRLGGAELELGFELVLWLAASKPRHGAS